MKIGIISDTHNQIDLIRKALEIFKKENVGMIIHAGDVDLASALEVFAEAELPIKMAIGNMDEEPERYLEKAKVLGLDFFMNSFLAINVDINVDNDVEVNVETGAGASAGEEGRGRGARRIYVFHGKVLGKLDEVINILAQSKKYDLVVYGHTHQPKIEKIGGILILNPGSLQPLVFGMKPSVAVYDASYNNVEFFEL